MRVGARYRAVLPGAFRSQRGASGRRSLRVVSASSVPASVCAVSAWTIVAVGPGVRTRHVSVRVCVYAIRNDVNLMSELFPGTVVTLRDLSARADLNERTALLPSKVLANGRREGFVIDGDAPEGINVHEKNYTVVDASARVRASAYNQLGYMFTHAERWAMGVEAFEAALTVASSDRDAARGEGCDALAAMAWTALRMNHKGVEFKGGGETTRIQRRHGQPVPRSHSRRVRRRGRHRPARSGTRPVRDDPVLLVSIVCAPADAQTDAPADPHRRTRRRMHRRTRRRMRRTQVRGIFYDDSAKCVRECSAQPSEP